MEPESTDLITEHVPADNSAGPEATPSPSASDQRRASWLASAQSLAITVVIAVFVITFLVQAFQIPSESMENTLLVGDYLLVDKVHYGHPGIWGGLLPYRPIARGDIIVFRYPVHPSQHFVKRVIGVPGDRVRLVNKRVLVNGVPVRENYVVYKGMTRDEYRDDFPYLDIPAPDVEARWWVEMRKLVHEGELLVPQDRYFVLGDNRDKSLDSRYWGFVPRENIIGRPLLIYWSVRSPDSPLSSSQPDDRLGRFVYSLTHVVQETRWERTFRIVR